MTNEKQIQQLLNFFIKATKNLSNIAFSLKKTGIAYYEFIANDIQNSIEDSKLNFFIQLGKRTGFGRIPITINLQDDEKIIIASYAMRLVENNKKLSDSNFSLLKDFVFFQYPAYFIIIYSEKKDFNKSYLSYKKQLKTLNFTISNFKKEINSSNVKIIETNFFHNEENYLVYHIFVNLYQEKEEIITKNKLINITINTFKLFENINVKLSPKVNILLGKNAFGKTTFLQALALANIPDNNPDINNYQEFAKQNYQEAEIITEREKEQTSTIIINTDGKTINNLKTNIHEPVFLAYGTNLFSRYTNHNYSNLINKLINGSKEWYFTKSIFEESTNSFYDPLGVLNTLNWEIGEKARELKNFILDTLNELLPKEFNISYDSVNKISYYFVDGSKNYLKTEQLSEGYKNNILLLTDIIIRLISINQSIKTDKNIASAFHDTKGIICIDEFDRHMHPLWQKSYVENLCNLLPNIQFILTTHNPISILGREEGEIQVFYRNNKNEIDIKQLPATLEIDAGTVLLTHFDMNSILSNDLQQKIDKFYELKTINNLSDKQQTNLLNLEKTLNDTFVGINIHDFRFLKFLNFLKENNINHRERLEELVIDEKDVNNFRNEFKEYYK